MQVRRIAERLDGTDGGFIIPGACAQGNACALELALNGCHEEASVVGSRSGNEAGINQWADTNRLVVYPDIVVSSAPAVTIPNACFDWWDYSKQIDQSYALTSEPQTSVVYASCSG